MANLDDLRKELEELRKEFKNITDKDFLDLDTSSIENTKKGIAAITAQIRLAKQEAEDLKNPFQSINAQLRAITDEWKTNSNGVRRAIQSTDKIRTITQKIEDHQKGYNSLSSKDLENQKGKLKSLQDQISSSETEIRNLLKENNLTEENLYLDEEGNRLSDENIKKRAEELGLSKKQFESIQSILESNTENLSIHENINNELDREIKKIKEIEDNLGVKTFSGLEDISKSIPGLRKFAAPFQDASKAAKDQAASNKMNFDNAKGISKESLNALKTGKGLNAAKIKELGLQDKLGNLTGKEAANKAKSLGITKQATAAISPMKAGFKSLGGAIKGAFGPVGLALIAIQTIVKVAKFFVDAMFGASKQVSQITRDLGVSKEFARETLTTIKQTGLAMEGVYINAAAFLETQNKINEALGLSLNLATGYGDNVRNQTFEVAKLSKKIGLNAQQEQRLLSDNLKTEEDITKEILGQLTLLMLEKGFHVGTKEILKETLSITGTLRANFKGNTAEIAKAVYQAKLLGFNLKDLEGIQSSLLDFQSSIEAELEAELLTGRQLNLEKARALALDNDLVGMAKELNKENITYSSFSKMNMFARQAIAKTFGMESNQMADLLQKQEDLNKLKDLANQKEFESLEILDENNEVQAKGGEAILKMLKKEGDQRNRIIAQLGEDTAQRLLNQDAQDKFNEALDKAKDVFTQFVTGGGLDNLATAINKLVSFLIGKEQLSRN